jgi:hypothetical protein
MPYGTDFPYLLDTQMELHRMFWLKLVAIVVMLTVGIFLIAFLEDLLVSAPRRRELQRKGREKLKGKADSEVSPQS